jgi:hypothetical protein
MSIILPYTGNEAKVYFIEEQNYGETPPNPTMVSLGVTQEVSLGYSPSQIKLRGIGSRDLQYIRKGLRKVDLKIIYALQNINFLQHVTTLNPLTMEIIYQKDSSVLSFRHKGCRLNSLMVECSAEEFVKVTAELFGKELQVATEKVGASYGDYDDPPLVFYDTYVKKNTTMLERVTDYRFAINNNLKRVSVISTSHQEYLKHLVAKQREVEGELTFEFESKEEIDEILNDVEFTLEFGLGGIHKIVFNHCKWSNLSLPTKLEELVTKKLEFTAKTFAIT